MTERGSGQTTQQMLSAPHGALFVCHTAAMMGYARDLAKHLKRDDLMIVSTNYIVNGSHRGLRRAVVFDHAVEFNHKVRAAFDLP